MLFIVFMLSGINVFSRPYPSMALMELILPLGQFSILNGLMGNLHIFSFFVCYLSSFSLDPNLINAYFYDYFDYYLLCISCAIMWMSLLYIELQRCLLVYVLFFMDDNKFYSFCFHFNGLISSYFFYSFSILISENFEFYGELKLVFCKLSINESSFYSVGCIFF